MKSFVVGVMVLVGMVFGIGVGVFAERHRPIPAEEVRFDPDSMSFVRQ